VATFQETKPQNSVCIPSLKLNVLIKIFWYNQRKTIPRNPDNMQLRIPVTRWIHYFRYLKETKGQSNILSHLVVLNLKRRISLSSTCITDSSCYTILHNGLLTVQIRSHDTTSTAPHEISASKANVIAVREWETPISLYINRSYPRNLQFAARNHIQKQDTESRDSIREESKAGHPVHTKLFYWQANVYTFLNIRVNNELCPKRNSNT
jgi:hypothetical protein